MPGFHVTWNLPDRATRAPHAPRGLLGITAGLGMWAIAMLYSFLRPNLWILDLILIPVMWILAIAGLALLAVDLVRLLAARGENRVGLGTAALIVVALVIVLVTVAVGAWWRFAPHAWFAAHRPLYEQALNTDPGDDYYGARLPFPPQLPLGDQQGVRRPRRRTLLPRKWIGIPDDSGDCTVLNPTIRPRQGHVRHDLRRPHDLGDGWWSCGLSDDHG